MHYVLNNEETCISNEEQSDDWNFGLNFYRNIETILNQVVFLWIHWLFSAKILFFSSNASTIFNKTFNCHKWSDNLILWVIDLKLILCLLFQYQSLFDTNSAGRWHVEDLLDWIFNFLSYEQLYRHHMILFLFRFVQLWLFLWDILPRSPYLSFHYTLIEQKKTTISLMKKCFSLTFYEWILCILTILIQNEWKNLLIFAWI